MTLLRRARHNLPDDAAGHNQLKVEERVWQDETGNDLIEQSYQCPGLCLVYERQILNIIDKIPVKNNTLLDIGCGRGQWLKGIAEKSTADNTRLVGLDISDISSICVAGECLLTCPETMFHSDSSRYTHRRSRKNTVWTIVATEPI